MCSHVAPALCIASVHRLDVLPELVERPGAPAGVLLRFWVVQMPVPALLPVVVEGRRVAVGIASVAVPAPGITTAPPLAPIVLLRGHSTAPATVPVSIHALPVA